VFIILFKVKQKRLARLMASLFIGLGYEKITHPCHSSKDEYDADGNDDFGSLRYK